MAIQVVQDIPAAGRVLRRPQHSFQLRHRPFQIQPFALAPVLPGETLKNALLQARVVTDPIKNPLVGWWYEMYLFYVKHRDMPDSSHFQNMVLSLNYDLTPAKTVAAKVENYFQGNAVDWADQCLRAVVPHYFRDDGEAYGAAMLGNLPAAKINSQTWLDSALPDSQLVDGGTIAGGSTVEATNLLLQQFQLMRDMKLTTMTYEEFLTSYGVRPTQAEAPNKPELIRYVRDWNYPSNTVNPADGSAASAMSWSIAERADKDRFFTEPGFVFGVAVARPKVYLSKQIGFGATMMADAMTWLPAMLAGSPETSLKRFDPLATPAQGPLTGQTEAYWVDVRDLLLYGDQFVNFAVTATDAGMVALPTAALQKKYVSSADVDALFKGVANTVRADGILSLTVAGSQRDHT
jgi:hypothetical protein